MISGLLVGLLALPGLDLKPFDLDIGISGGYNHYQAGDLNKVMVLLEQTTREASGFNHYTVTGFDGHPATQAFFGMTKGDWRFGLEMEFWTETFAQKDVPFDAENPDRKVRITCADLYAAADTLSTRAGCLDAQETFRFVPITLQAAWVPQWKPWLRSGVGYGFGVLAGDASLNLHTVYLGPGSAKPDRISLEIVPTPLVAWVHKAWASAEVLPVSWLGLELRGGMRYTMLGGLKIDKREGESRVLDLIFDTPKEGDRLYVRNPSGYPEQTTLFIGTPAEAKAQTRYDFHQVNGDFTGWFVSLGLNFHWGIR
jgi:hypothetical protein